VHRLRQQTECGHPRSETTSGFVAYLDGEPVGWCAVEAYPIVTTDVIAEELHVGTVGVFAAAGFSEVAGPTLRRAVMRIDY
jgi:hypothetical protein